jgi:membrane fusion protein, copper/silver efflux system
MKRASIPRLITAVFLLLAVTGGTFLWFRSDNDVREKVPPGPLYTAGPFRIHTGIDPEQPRVGKNRLTIAVYDKDDRPVDHARIQALAEMAAMGTMPAMPAPAEMRTVGNGLYQGRFEIPMAGAWPLTVTIAAGGETAELSFEMNTSSKGLRLTNSTPSPLGTQPDQPISTIPRRKKATEFTVDAHRRQLIGVTTEEVAYQTLTQTVRAAAVVAYDETRLTDISLKFDAWIGQLYADAIGAPVKKGQVLLTVYSPELVSAQDEYLQTLRRSGAAAEALRLASRRRLALWDIGPDQIRALERRGRAADYLPIRSPVTGTVIDKRIVAGTAVKAGSRLLRIADLSRVWVDGQVYQSELPLVHAGMAAEVVLPDDPGRTIHGTVSFVYPFLEGETRTARVRVEVPNPNGLLRPEQYAQLRLTAYLGKRLVVPESAVLYAGDLRIVFLDLGDGRLEPRRITTGLRSDDLIEVVNGLKAGDIVVSSGNFLIAAESKLKAGIDQW